MNRKLRVIQDFFTFTSRWLRRVNIVPDWRRVMLALLLAFLIGSVGQMPLAQAAPPAAEVRYSLIAYKLKRDTTICVGDDVPIRIRVSRATFVGSQGDNVQDIPGAHIEASMSNPGIGTLHPISIYTGWDSNDPGGAVYKFHASKVGRTTINFKGTINHIWWPAILGLPKAIDRRDFVEDQVQIEVQECQYKVTTISHWKVPGEANVQIEATLDGAGLTDDGTGLHYNGNGSVTWHLTGGQVEDCVPQSVTTTSQAELVGERDGDLLIVDITYLIAAISIPVYCVRDGEVASGSMPVDLLAEPVSFTVPGSGGGVRETHVLQWPEPEEGFVVAIVKQVTGQ